MFSPDPRCQGLCGSQQETVTPVWAVSSAGRAISCHESSVVVLVQRGPGPASTWEVVNVAFAPGAGRIDLQVAFRPGTRFVCPHCGAEHQPVHDTQEREWRHLNVFPYPAHLRAKVPRVRGAACGKTAQVPVPWARPDSGFTLLMAALIVTLCQAMPVRPVAQLLAVSDLRGWRTLDHYVDAARAQEDFSAVAAVGLDETAARRGTTTSASFTTWRRALAVRLRWAQGRGRGTVC